MDSLIGYNPNALIDEGGGLLIAQEISKTDYSVVSPAAGTTTVNVGYIADSETAETTSSTKYKDETKQTIKKSDEYEYGIKFTAQQTDKATIDFFGNTVKGKAHLAIKYLGYNAGKYNWLFMLGEFVPQFNISAPGGMASNKQELIGLQNKAAVTYSASTLACISTLLTLSNFPTSLVTLSAGKCWSYVEVS